MEIILLTLVLIGFLNNVISQEWVHTSGPPPLFPFSGGTVGTNGRTLYVCRASVGGEMCSGKTWLSGGRLVSCKVPYGEKEYSRSYFDVLTAPPWADYELTWSESTYSWGNVPDGAVSVGSGIYVGRYEQNEGYRLGKVNYDEWAFFYTKEGNEYFKNINYEVLTIKSRPISHYEIFNVQYDLSKATQTLSSDDVILASKNVANDSPYHTTSSLSMDITETKTSQWSETDSLEMHTGISLSVSAGIPFIGEVSGQWEAGLSSSYSYTYGESFTSSVTTSHEISVDLPEYSEARVSMIARMANVIVPYTATVRVVFRNGYTYIMHGTKGVFTNAHHTTFQTTVEISGVGTSASPAIVKNSPTSRAATASLYSPSFRAEWVHTSGKPPPFPFSGDTVDTNGRTLYVCRVLVGGEMCSGKTWFSGGRLVSCKVPHGEKEFSGSYFDVLTAPPWADYELTWSESTYSWGNVPHGAVSVGSGIYVGRYEQNGGYLLGKVNFDEWAFFYTEEGKEKSKSEHYEVLTIKSRQIARYEIVNIEYALTEATQTLSADDVILASTNVANVSPYHTTPSLSMDITETKTSQWFETDSLEMHTGINVSVSAGIPFISEVSGQWEAGLSSTYSYTYGESFVSSVTSSHEINVNLPGYSDARVSMIARMANVIVPYTATVRVVFRNGYTYIMHGAKGVFTNAYHTAFQTTVETFGVETSASPAIVKNSPIIGAGMASLFCPMMLPTLFTL